jgi:glycine hydroxymethyltransferase
VVANASALAAAFVSMGYELISRGTDNHLMLIDLRNKNVSGKKAEQALVKADITLNKNMVPFDDKSAFITSGIRIGTPAITTRGMREEHMSFIAECVDAVIRDADSDSVLVSVKKKVNEFMTQFPLYPELDR